MTTATVQKPARVVTRSRTRRAGEPRTLTPVRIAEKGATGAPAMPVPITWGGHAVDAPGFDQDRFDRAMARAFIDDLRLESLGGDAFLVYHPAARRGHRVTRETCTCPAGEHDVPCKHRALVIAHLDIRMPEIARRWARRQRARKRAAEKKAA